MLLRCRCLCIIECERTHHAQKHIIFFFHVMLPHSLCNARMHAKRTFDLEIKLRPFLIRSIPCRLSFALHNLRLRQTRSSTMQCPIRWSKHKIGMFVYAIAVPPCERSQLALDVCKLNKKCYTYSGSCRAQKIGFITNFSVCSACLRTFLFKFL